jgi:hypothetical protein
MHPVVSEFCCFHGGFSGSQKSFGTAWITWTVAKFHASFHGIYSVSHYPTFTTFCTLSHHHITDDVMWFNKSACTKNFRSVKVALALESTMAQSDVTSSWLCAHSPPAPNTKLTVFAVHQDVLFFSSASSILFLSVLDTAIAITRCVTSLSPRIENLPVLLACWNDLRGDQSHPWIT